MRALSKSDKPSIALGNAELIEDAAVEAAEDLAHEGDGGVGDEVGAVDVHASDAGWEEAGAVDVPDVVGGGRRIDERWAVREAAAAEAGVPKWFTSTETPIKALSILGASEIIISTICSATMSCRQRPSDLRGFRDPHLGGLRA